VTGRVLVLRRGALGDTLLLTPLLRALRRRSPTARLEVAGVREFADVLVAYGVVDAACSSEDLALWSPERSRDRLASFDEVVDVDAALDRLEPGVPFALQLARRLGFAVRWPDDAWLLPAAGAPVARAGPIVLAPGSGGRAKCWPRSRWLELAARVERADRAQVVIGPVEQERDDPRGWPWPNAPDFLVDRTATALAAEFARAACYVGNDSGTTHLAALLSVPTVAVFGASDPALWAPVGPHVTVVGSRSAWPSTDAVAAALRRRRSG
jgi:ADP-heptose:LPS heptosyltransferase